MFDCLRVAPRIAVALMLLSGPTVAATLDASETRCSACTTGSDTINAITDTFAVFGPTSVTAVAGGGVFFDRSLFDLSFIDADTLAIDIPSVGSPTFGGVLSGFSSTILSVASTVPSGLLENAEFFVDFTDDTIGFFIDRSAIVDDRTNPGRITIDIEFDGAVIPLPGSLPLVIAGVGVLGFAARRKKKQS